MAKSAARTALIRSGVVVVYVAFFVLTCVAECAAQAGLPADLDAYVARSMKTFDVPGLAIAIVKDGKEIGRAHV